MKIIIISGPTGTGKTELSLDLAKLFKTEIISADSMQIYKGMDIGTAKIKKDEMEGIVHHLIDIVEPDEDFTVEDFRRQATAIIKDLNLKSKIPIIVGGTGLYIDSLIYDLDFTIAPPNENIRNYYETLAKAKGNVHIHNILKLVDPISADKNHPNQLKRIIRALEVFDYTGKAFSSFDNSRKLKENVDFIYLVLTRDRDVIYKRINDRVDMMVKAGLVEEVRGLKDKGYTRDFKSIEAIGYKEIYDYLDGFTSLDEAIDRIKMNSRRYAKRQLSWFRREARVEEIFIDQGDTKNYILEKCLNKIGEYNGFIK